LSTTALTEWVDPSVVEARLMCLGGAWLPCAQANRGCGIQWKSTELHGMFPTQLRPAIPMRGQACRIDASGATGSTAAATSSSWRSNRSCRSDRGCGIQWNFHRVAWKNFSNATGLEGLFCHLNRCCYGHRILGSSSTVDSH